MKKIFFGLALLFSLTIYAQLESPSQFLPNYGTHVSYYHQLENYFSHLTSNSEYILHNQYGETAQERSLNVYFISTPGNLKELENIRQTNLYNTGMGSQPATSNEKAIIWLSFNVHGNEMGAAESAMQVAYELVNPENTDTKKWLENTIVILDPCLNPDGYARYGNWLRGIAGKDTHPERTDREHKEPWPGGRQNHYSYDLNRDWAWQTQAETRQRMVIYNLWMPMVHVDVHEMGYNEPYFFPPAAEPIHDYITNYQKEFHDKIGENTAKKFDKKDWSYYTRERFDLFYPSYGDTYPCFNGAVGMTYEQGGINAGRAVQMLNGDVLTLQDRIDHHTLAVLTAVQTTAMQKDKLIKNFRLYFNSNNDNPVGKYKTYIIKNNGKIPQLAQLLSRNRVAYAYAAETRKMKGYHYQTGDDDDFILEPNDLIVTTNQPKKILTQVFFEPHQHLSDSLSYDITAWALPYAYGAESYALKNIPDINTKQELSYKGKLEYERVYAYYVPWNGRESVQVLASLHKNKVKVRSARKQSLFTGIAIKPGDLIILKSDNKQLADFEGTMGVLLIDKPDYEVIESGFAVKGADLGGEYYPLLKAPKVLLLSGEDVSATDFGQVWYYMEQIINYPLSIMEANDFSSNTIDGYTTLILPNGNYTLKDEQKQAINNFIDNGGKVIAIDGALQLFADEPDYSLASKVSEDNENGAKEVEKPIQDFTNYENAERLSISESVSGAIVQNRIDKSHPLAYGLGESYFSLKTGASCYAVNEAAQNVIYIPDGYKSYGFIGSRLKSKLANTTTFAVEQKGEGQAIYMVDNPLFRGFWENGNLLFSNALFLVD